MSVTTQYERSHAVILGETALMDKGMTTEKENEEMQRMTSFGRPFRNNAFKIMVPMKTAPSAEVKHYTANSFFSSTVAYYPNLIGLLNGMLYAPTTQTDSVKSRTTNHIHLLGLNMKINFLLKAQTVATSFSVPLNMDLRVIVVRTVCLPPYSGSVSTFISQLLNSSSLSGSSIAPYNPYFSSFFQVLYDQQVSLCSTALAGVGSTPGNFYPFYPDFAKSLSINMDLNNMHSEFPVTTANTASEPQRGGLYLVTLSGNSAVNSGALTYDCTWRVRFIDR